MRASFLKGCVATGLILLALVVSIATNVLPVSLARTGFVTRSGAQLFLDGQAFRFSGANIYWLGLDENVNGIQYPTHFRIDDALATAHAMGAAVVRSHTLGISVGCPLCIEPALNEFNATAFQSIDYAIKSAHDHDLRLVIPLVDNWHYYHGGKHTFTDWRGVADEQQFYYNKTVISDFERYFSHILNHVNRYTHLAYKDDPTILAWETGNEINPPTSWTQTIAAKIKNIDHHHLVMDGTEGINFASLSLPAVDIYSDHFYPMSASLVDADARTVKDAGKVFIAGEYDWANRNGGDPLGSFLSAVEKDDTSGDLFWSLFAHNDMYGYVQHNDGYTLHYPGDTPDMRARAQMLRRHAYHMRDLAVAREYTPGVPRVTSVIGNTLTWRGVTDAATYTVARSTVGPNGPWEVICNRCATDNDVPWMDLSQPPGKLWYKVAASNRSGVNGYYSSVYPTE